MKEIVEYLKIKVQSSEPLKQPIYSSQASSLSQSSFCSSSSTCSPPTGNWVNSFEIPVENVSGGINAGA
ncbi:hypothetical protein AMELA_G00076030 [Ameiurus melas]|uniref:Uncharacterized protein n=1 Tax=Ameiurus melas TaxID=219545 RepID=A0A7J6B089_AMEME|nr:hypothetical protein AMELA_G00076030 [Ameiurus melas]